MTTNSTNTEQLSPQEPKLLKSIIDDIHYIKQSFFRNASEIEKVNLHTETLDKNLRKLRDDTRKELKDNIDLVIDQLQSLGKKLNTLREQNESAYQNSPLYKELNDKIGNLKLSTLNESKNVYNTFISDLDKLNANLMKEIEILRNQVYENQTQNNTLSNSVEEIKNENVKKEEELKNELDKIRQGVQDSIVKK
jgi:predicted  nucleic acid-binding Zn-ribbon protein